MKTLPLLSRIFIMATERLPGYDVLVGCFEEDVHRTNLADDNWLYFIGLDASGTPQGFAPPHRSGERRPRLGKPFPRPSCLQRAWLRRCRPRGGRSRLAHHGADQGCLVRTLRARYAS